MRPPPLALTRSLTARGGPSALRALALSRPPHSPFPALRLGPSRALSTSSTSVLTSNVDRNAPEFVDKAKGMAALEAELDAVLGQVELGGGEKARRKVKEAGKGKMLVRERIEALVDPLSPFLELSPLAAHEVYGCSLPAAGIITGIGSINGTECMIFANDATVKGGSYHPLTVKKQLRAQEIAAENRLPCVYLVESGGASLPHQADVFPDKEHFGRIFYNMARMSRDGIPQLSVVHGISVAGGAYAGAMADMNIIVKEQGFVGLAGVPLVKASLGEVVDAETLGGGAMHTSVSGVCDQLADSDAHALELAREAVAAFSYTPQLVESVRAKPAEEAPEPLYDPAELGGIVGTNVKQAFDMREVIARVVDGSRFTEWKKDWGETVITGFSHIHGYPVGIIANNGILFSDSALKASQFILLCEQRSIPLVFLVNVAGFMVGKDAERGGIAKNGAKLVRAVAATSVPKLTVVVGGSYGAGNYGMCGRSYGPRFMWMWPNAKVSVMGADQLSDVMSSVSSDAERNSKLKQQIEDQSMATYASARLWDDGVIKPSDTRTVLGLGLGVAMKSWDPMQEGRGKFGVFRM